MYICNSITKCHSKYLSPIGNLIICYLLLRKFEFSWILDSTSLMKVRCLKKGTGKESKGVKGVNSL